MDFVRQSLPKHCETLGIPLEVISLPRDESGWWVGEEVFKKPEQAALQWFRNQGWHGTRTEGSPILMTMKCAGFEWMVKHNFFNTRLDAIRDAPMSAMTHHIDKIDRYYAEVKACSEAVFLKNFLEVYGDGIVQSLHPYLNQHDMLAVFRALKPKLIDIARIFVTRPYDLRSGWPDLCLVKGDQVQFAEVKTTDNLHGTQYDVINNILKPLNLLVKVVKLIKQK